MGNSLLIRKGYLVDPDTGFEGVSDLLVRDGTIRKRGADLPCPEDGVQVVDAEGLVVMPGLVDLHVHFRDPGLTYKEDLASGTGAAAHGGVTAVLAMPNTKPPADSVERLRAIAERAGAVSPVHVYQASSITKGMEGLEAVDVEAICGAGFSVFSEDGKSVMDAHLLRDAMRRIAAAGGLICDHCEDIGMVDGGVMNEDANARRLRLRGISNSVEDTIAARDIVLAAETGARLHLCHCSTEGSVKILRAAKREGVAVTAEVCPHHFLLTSDDIPGDDANWKMNPPLRTRRDVDALVGGLLDGTIDCISTDHAPHGAEEKGRGFAGSPFGIVGLETSAALTYTHLVKPGLIKLMDMARLMSRNPAAILGIPGGSLAEGMPADISVFDFSHPHVIDPAAFVSKGKNTPFAGMEVYGTVRYTFVGGRTAWEEAL